jgi:hypothetical protein
MWRSCPFEKGRRYVVLKDISFLNHHFKKDTTVIFKDCSYGFHDGVTRFWFSHLEDDSKTDIWHVFDNEPDPAEKWSEFFTPA